MMNGKGMCSLHKVSWVLVIVGALNWGLVGLADFNLVTTLLGAWPVLVRVIYVLVGVSALAMLAAGKCCMKDGGGCNCSMESCSHCGPNEHKPMMGGEQKM